MVLFRVKHTLKLPGAFQNPTQKGLSLKDFDLIVQDGAHGIYVSMKVGTIDAIGQYCTYLENHCSRIESNTSTSLLTEQSMAHETPWSMGHFISESYRNLPIAVKAL